VLSIEDKNRKKIKKNMKIEDLMIECSVEQTELAELLENRLIAIRNKNRRQNAKKIIEQNAHRRETVTRFRGVNFVNDSISASVNATYFCMKMISTDIVWIAGGDDHQTNYQELASLVSQKVKVLVCIGKDNTHLIETFGQYIPIIYQCKNMDEAVRKAFYAANQGNTVLLSTASPCDSQFKNYQVRGNAFKYAVAQL
jgi:UDP-N-acetylmuramoylalanine--D-glutamate ligase